MSFPLLSRALRCAPVLIKISGSGSVQCAKPLCVTLVRKQHAYNVAESNSKKSWKSKLYDVFFVPDEEFMTEEEETQRDELLEKIRSCYYEKPPTVPGQELYSETIDLLIKYNDYKGVEVILELAQHENVSLDDEILDKAGHYLDNVEERKRIF